MAKQPKPTRTPTSDTDAARNFRIGCGFLVGIVIVLWLFLWLAWTFWPPA